MNEPDLIGRTSVKVEISERMIFKTTRIKIILKQNRVGVVYLTERVGKGVVGISGLGRVGKVNFGNRT